MFGSKARKENEQLKQRIEELERLFESIGATDVVEADRRRRELQEQQAKLSKEIQTQRAQLTEQSQTLQAEIATSAEQLKNIQAEDIKVRKR